MKEILEEYCGYIKILNLYRYILDIDNCINFQIVDDKVMCYIRKGNDVINIKIFKKEENLYMFFKSLE